VEGCRLDVGESEGCRPGEGRGTGLVRVRTSLSLWMRAPFLVWVRGANNRIIEKIFE
jgi:hypothetical protein